MLPTLPDIYELTLKESRDFQAQLTLAASKEGT